MKKGETDSGIFGSGRGRGSRRLAVAGRIRSMEKQDPGSAPAKGSRLWSGEGREWALWDPGADGFQNGGGDGGKLPEGSQSRKAADSRTNACNFITNLSASIGGCFCRHSGAIRLMER